MNRNPIDAGSSSVSVAMFVEGKVKQLCFYLRAFWQEELPYAELDLFFWDTMEEWSQVNYNFEQPYSSEERVFWHLLHQIHYWPEEKLLHDTYLVEELANCIHYLEGKGFCPFDCIGIRP